MELCHSIEEMRNQIKKWKKCGKKIGFVPTMGYLHQGHMSLVERAKKENDIVVLSIFVNPMQFGPDEDFFAYPRDMKQDKILCETYQVDAIFCPQAEEMYEKGYSCFVDMNTLTQGLCGKSRPGHFRGVQTIVLKLFHIIEPDQAYFGQKDAQQLIVIRKMVKDLNLDIRIVGCPIVREEDGLAISSRNTYLSVEERKAALILSESLAKAKKQMEEGELDAITLKEEIRKKIKSEPLAVIDYVEIVDTNTLSSITRLNGNILIAIAVWIGKTRLIDNIMVKIEETTGGRKCYYLC